MYYLLTSAVTLVRSWLLTEHAHPAAVHGEAAGTGAEPGTGTGAAQPRLLSHPRVPQLHEHCL